MDLSGFYFQTPEGVLIYSHFLNMGHKLALSALRVQKRSILLNPDLTGTFGGYQL